MTLPLPGGQIAIQKEGLAETGCRFAFAFPQIATSGAAKSLGLKNRETGGKHCSHKPQQLEPSA